MFLSCFVNFLNGTVCDTSTQHTGISQPFRGLYTREGSRRHSACFPSSLGISRNHKNRAAFEEMGISLSSFQQHSITKVNFFQAHSEST